MPDAPDQPRHRRPRGSHAPLSDADLIEIADRAFDGLGAVVLAVSGGADSLSLMLMADRWRAASGRPDLPIIVACVDHGLRPEAAEEAQWAASEGAARGFATHVLQWRSPKPASGLQAAARDARYDLLRRLVDDLGLPRPCGILVGHHLDDQAETFLMRLARGSGLDGLAAMPAERALTPAGDVVLRRPFLSLAKATLVSTLSSRGWTWIEDPSNADDRFERVRLRKALSHLADLGVDAAAISTSAARLARARGALEDAVLRLRRVALRAHDGAYAEIDASAFDAAPEEMKVRLMQSVLEGFGSGGEPVRMAQVEALVERLSGEAVTLTLGGCHLERQAATIAAFREPGRSGLPIITLRPGEEKLWDNRFRVGCESGAGRDVEVRAMTAAEWKTAVLENEGGLASGASDLPRRAVLSLPSFWMAGRLVAMPHPAVGLSGSGQFTAVFAHDCP